MMARTLPEGEAALKAYTRLLIERVGGLDAAAACTRVGRSQLANYCSPHQDQFVPVDVLARLEEIAGAPLVTEELLRRHGLVASKPRGSASASIHSGLAVLAGEMSDLHRVYAEGQADGQLSTADEVRIQRELQHVIRQASGLMADLQARLAAAEASPPAGGAPLPFRRP